MYKVYNALEALSEWRAENVRFELFEQGSGQSVHLNLGVLQAGDWVSTVPGEAVLEGRIGFIPGENREKIKKLIYDTVQSATIGDEWLEEHPPEVEWFGWSTDSWYQDPEHPFVKTFMKTAGGVIGRDVDVIGRASGN